MATKIQLEDAMNGLLSDSGAVAGPLSGNLRSASNTYSITQVDQIVSTINSSIGTKANTSMISTREPNITSANTSYVWQGNKTWALKTSLPINDATQAQITTIQNSITTTNGNVTTLETNLERKKLNKDPLDYASVPATLNYDFTDYNGAPFAGNLIRSTIGGYYLNNRGVLVPTAINEPVIDFDSNKNPKGTGFYGAYTQVTFWSEDFSNATWAKSDATISTNAAVSPDGTSTADKLVETATNSIHYVAQTDTLGAVTMTFSVFIKDAGRTKARIQISDTVSSVCWANVDLVAKTVTATSFPTHWTSGSAAITEIANGWFLASITATSDQGTTKSPLICSLDSSGNVTYTGDGTSGIYIWGAQLTATAFPVPYIPTTSAAVTRNADIMVIGGADFTDFFNPNEGTFFCEFAPGQSNSYPGVFEFTNFNASNRIGLVQDGSWPRSIGVVKTDSVDQVALYTAASTINTFERIAMTYSPNLSQLSRNGATVLSDTNLTLPNGIDRLIIGYWDASLNGRIRRLIYWPKALTSTELQNMTL